MFTGRQALSSVEQAISQVRSDEGRLDGALRSAVDEAARARKAKADNFRALARIRLDTMMRERVIHDLDATERRVVSMLDSHREQMDGLARRRDAAQTALDKAEAEKHGRDEELAEAQEELEKLTDEILEKAQATSEWQAADAAVTTATQIAENAEKKATLAQQDLTEKGAPYENDPLFMYLWQKKHGTSADTSGAFVRFIDRKVAKLIGYRDARANYAMLKEIPLRLREHASNKAADVAEARQRVEEVERKALTAGGADGIKEKVATREAAVKAAAEEVMRITADLQKTDAERDALLQDGGDSTLTRAVDVLADALSREDIRKLYDDARRTPSPADDRIVSSIASADSAIARSDQEVAEIRAQIREMARRRSELEGARDRARSAGYDNPRGTFGGNGSEVIGDVIGGILRGALRGGALDQILRDNYRVPRRRRSRSPRWGDSSGPSWPSPWGGGGGGGSSSGGGSSDDGGWRTGGSF